jgi:hypothetical protein
MRDLTCIECGPGWTHSQWLIDLGETQIDKGQAGAPNARVQEAGTFQMLFAGGPEVQLDEIVWAPVGLHEQFWGLGTSLHGNMSEELVEIARISETNHK